MFTERNQLLTRIANAGLNDLLEAFSCGEVTIEELVRYEIEEDLRGASERLRSEKAQHVAVPPAARVEQSPGVTAAVQVVTMRASTAISYQAEAAVSLSGHLKSGH